MKPPGNTEIINNGSIFSQMSLEYIGKFLLFKFHIYVRYRCGCKGEK